MRLQSAFAVFCLGLTAFSFAHVRQKSFYQSDAADISKGGVETILHWNSSVPVFMHNFSGCAGSGSTASLISFNGSEGGCSANAQQIVGDSISQWFADSPLNSQFSVLPNLNVVLSGGDLPSLTNSACETTSTGTADGKNNILFATKVNSSCANSIADYTGVIGLTRVRYSVTEGEIVEADIQLNDAVYRFVEGTPSGSIEVNLQDVMVHELGHFWGLDHSSTRTSSMLFALSDGMSTAAMDDSLGMWSLYQNSSSSLGKLKGSVTLGGEPQFGVSVVALNARSLEIVAAEMTNLDGVFEFCGLPDGNYIAYANSYRPASSNIHEYYSGFFGTTREVDGLCANPGCSRMDTRIQYSWFLEDNENTDPFGKTMKIFSVSGGTTNKYLNIEGTTASTSVPAHDGSAIVDLDLDSPRLMRFKGDNLDASGGDSLTNNQFRVMSSGTGDLNIKVASLSLYSRLNIAINIEEEFDPGNYAGNCTSTPSLPNEGRDPSFVCNSLTPAPTSYIITLSATSLACNTVPGNVNGCASSSSELASTNEPIYMVNVYDPNSLENGLATTSLASVSLGNTEFSNLPSCSDYKTTIDADQEPAGCCGSIGGGGIDPRSSFLLALLMSPLSWALLLIFGYRINARLKQQS